MSIIEEIFDKFLFGLPDIRTTLLLLAVFSLWAFICVQITAFLKVNKGVRTGYTRKVFHFLVFVSVAIINTIYGFSGVCLFGALICGFVIFAVIKGRKSRFYLSLARENDIPNERLYVVLPLLSTLVGGLMLNYYYPAYVVLGYLVCGLGDASGEVVGTWIGRHKFRVPFVNIHNSFKSIEGSLSVFIISFFIYLVFAYYNSQVINSYAIFSIFVVSAIIVVTEILTPKGFDNFTIQLISVVAYIEFFI